MSFVWGPENIAFLRARYKEMSAHHCYKGMEYSEDRKEIAAWVPLVMTFDRLQLRFRSSLDINHLSCQSGRK